jgi:large subunit ribosomal protein L31
MKQGIHPRYVNCMVTCACGNTFMTRAAKNEIRVEICSNCHPFYTGQQKIVDTEGRIERFVSRYARYEERAKKTAAAKKS